MNPERYHFRNDNHYLLLHTARNPLILQEQRVIAQPPLALDNHSIPGILDINCEQSKLNRGIR